MVNFVFNMMNCFINDDELCIQQTLQGGTCGTKATAAKWKAVPAPAAASTMFQIQSINIGGRPMPGLCIGYQAKMPPSHGPPPLPPPPGQEWRDPNGYFADQSLQRANLRSASGECVYSPGWSNCFVMDPLEPSYLGLLLREARRHVALLGDDFAGVACDRGWAQLNNAHADDGISYVQICCLLCIYMPSIDRSLFARRYCAGAGKQGGGYACRSLLYSQRKAMAQIGAVFHSAGLYQKRYFLYQKRYFFCINNEEPCI